MLRVAAIVCLVFLVVTSSADAETPLLEVSQQTAPFGTTQVVVSVVGTPLHFFAVGRSTANSGLVVGGLPLQLGTDASLAGSGQLDAQGLGSFALSLSPGPSTVHLQGFTAADTGFGGFVTSPGKTVTVLAAAPTAAPPPPRLFSGGGFSVLGASQTFAALQGSGTSGPPGGFQLVPAVCVAQSLQGRSAPALGVGDFVTVTLTVEGADTLACTINAGDTTCDSGAATQSIAAGAVAGIRVDSSTVGLVRVTYGFVCP